MSLVLQSSGGGQITIQEPATASNFTQTLPAATGEVMVSGNQPAFSAYQSTNQTLSTSTATKIQFQTEEFDTNNAFDNATNYRFTPQVAGYYQTSGAVTVNSTNCTITPYIYKNGSIFKIGSQPSNSGVASMSTLVYLNGSTDYIEFWVSLSVGQQLAATEFYTYFQAALVRTA